MKSRELLSKVIFHGRSISFANEFFVQGLNMYQNGKIRFLLRIF